MVLVHRNIHYFIKECRSSKISLPVEPENIAAQRLWNSVGFEMTDHMEDGYIFMQLYIPKYLSFQLGTIAAIRNPPFKINTLSKTITITHQIKS